MAISRLDTFNEELGLIMMDAFSILASVGLIMILLVITLSDYNPVPLPGVPLECNPIEVFENSDDFTSVTSNQTKRILRDLNIRIDLQGITVKATDIFKFQYQSLIDSSADGPLDLSLNGNSMEYFDIGYISNGTLEIGRILLCPKINIDGEQMNDAAISIKFGKVIEGQKELKGQWFITTPEILLYSKDSAGRYKRIKRLIEKDYPIRNLLWSNFAGDFKARG